MAKATKKTQPAFATGDTVTLTRNSTGRTAQALVTKVNPDSGRVTVKFKDGKHAANQLPENLTLVKRGDAAMANDDIAKPAPATKGSTKVVKEPTVKNDDPVTRADLVAALARITVLEERVKRLVDSTASGAAPLADDDTKDSAKPKSGKGKKNKKNKVKKG